MSYIKLNVDNKDDYYNLLQTMENYTDENMIVSGTSREGFYEIIMEESIDTDKEEDEEEPDIENDDE